MVSACSSPSSTLRSPPSSWLRTTANVSADAFPYADVDGLNEQIKTGEAACRIGEEGLGLTRAAKWGRERAKARGGSRIAKEDTRPHPRDGLQPFTSTTRASTRLDNRSLTVDGNLLASRPRHRRAVLTVTDQVALHPAGVESHCDRLVAVEQQSSCMLEMLRLVSAQRTCERVWVRLKYLSTVATWLPHISRHRACTGVQRAESAAQSTLRTFGPSTSGSPG